MLACPKNVYTYRISLSIEVIHPALDLGDLPAIALGCMPGSSRGVEWFWPGEYCPCPVMDLACPGGGMQMPGSGVNILQKKLILDNILMLPYECCIAITVFLLLFISTPFALKPRTVPARAVLCGADAGGGLPRLPQESEPQTENPERRWLVRGGAADADNRHQAWPAQRHSLPV